MIPQHPRTPFVLTLIIAFSLLAHASAAAAGTASWSVVTSDNVSGAGSIDSDALYAIASIPGTGNLFTVGDYETQPSTNPSDTNNLIEQCSGSSCTTMTVPNACVAENSLTGVTAISSADAYASGYCDQTNAGNNQMVILQYSSTGWSSVSGLTSLSGVSSSLNYDLMGISADSSSDVWAVGDTMDASGNSEPLALHYDGSSWSLANPPTLPSGTTGMFMGVVAISPTNVWAVGEQTAGTGQASVMTPLIEHRTSSGWSVVTPTVLSGISGQLNGVSGDASGDIFAVGQYNSSGVQDTLVLAYNGTTGTWTQQSSQNPSTADNDFNAASVYSGSDVWAVGEYGFGKYSLTEHFDGTSWTTASSPSPGSQQNTLDGVVDLGPSDAWAAGLQQNTTSLPPPPTPSQTLVLHYAIPTISRLANLTLARHNGVVTLRWRLSDPHGVIGFRVHAGSHQLTHRLIPVHASSRYHFSTRYRDHAPLSLEVLLTNGQQVLVPVH